MQKIMKLICAFCPLSLTVETPLNSLASAAGDFSVVFPCHFPWRPVAAENFLCVCREKNHKQYHFLNYKKHSTIKTSV